MLISQIYEKYLIPKNLQEHMLRVAALSKILIKNWTGQLLNEEAIVRSCLLHDIAKPLTFDLNKQARFGMDQFEIEKLKKLQQRLISNYGTVEHDVSIAICKELGMDQNVIKIVGLSEWASIPLIIKEKNWSSMVQIYCDMRIGPKGILSLKNRLMDLEKREPAKNHKLYESNGKLLENNIKNNVNLELDSISDSYLNNQFKQLLNIDI